MPGAETACFALFDTTIGRCNIVCGGFSAASGIRTKLRRLTIDDAMRGTPGLFD